MFFSFFFGFGFFLWGEWFVVVGAEVVSFGIFGVGVFGDVDGGGVLVEPAFASPTSEEGVEEGDGAAALGVVAIPVDVSTWVDEGGR